MSRPWLILLASAVLEAVWANALSASMGFTRLWPSVLFVVATILSTVGLAVAMKSIPTGTAYAVWTSVGTVLTVAYSVSIGAEEISWMKVLLLVGIVGCVIGLKVLDKPSPQRESSGSTSAAVG